MKRECSLPGLFAVGISKPRMAVQFLFMLLLGTSTAWAGSICPAGSGINPFPHSPDDANTGCNVVITINPDMSVSSVVMDPNPYEASEDALIGVRNNSASPVSTLTLSGAGIFGLEGDGICTFTFTGSGYCAANGASAGVDPFDYYGPTTTYTNITNSFSTGTVNFNPAILPGGTTYFSLEGLPTASLGGTVGTPTTFTVTYDGNGSTGGSVPVDGAAYPSGATVTVLGNTGNLVRVGSTFLGWNTAANGSGTGYVGGATFTMGSSNVTLYAQWSGSTVAPLSNIPTLNEWMLILLSGLLGWFSLVQLRRPIRNKQR